VYARAPRGREEVAFGLQMFQRGLWKVGRAGRVERVWRVVGPWRD
jgi:hypothetical protein